MRVGELGLVLLLGLGSTPVLAERCASAEKAANKLLKSGVVGQQLVRETIQIAQQNGCESNFLKTIIGQGYLQSGDNKKALRMLKRAYDNRNPEIGHLKLLAEAQWLKARNSDLDVSVRNRAAVEAGSSVGLVVQLASQNDIHLDERFEELMAEIDNYVSTKVDQQTLVYALSELTSARSLAVQRANLSMLISFDTSSARLDTIGREQIGSIGSSLVQYFGKNPNAHVYVIGHADIRGEESANIKLSEARANTVVDSLISIHGEFAGKLIPVGRGESEPRYQQDNDLAHTGNRRVEFDVQNE